MYDRPLDATESWLKKKFTGKDDIIEANTRAMNAGYNYADTTELFTTRFKVEKASLTPGDLSKYQWKLCNLAWPSSCSRKVRS